MPDVVHYTSHDGLDLVAYSYGPADAKLTILCVHGLTRNHKDFEPMIACLNKSYRFIAVDVRGRGESAYDPDPYNYTIPVYARDMTTLLDHLGVEKFVLVGTSMGGLISMVLMKTMPDRVSAVVLNDIAPSVQKRGIARILSYIGKTGPFPDWETAIDSVTNSNRVAFPDYERSDWAAFTKRICREMQTGEVIVDYDPQIAKAFRRIRTSVMTTYFAWRLFDAMAAVPLLLIRGALSDLLSEKIAKRMLHRHGNGKLVTVHNVGHAPVLNEPEAVTALTGFLKELE